jgi:hypothetical protein
VADRLIKSIDPFPKGISGRGIVTCGGGYKYFTNAWVLIRMLRHLGCQLPIQLWYLGPDEVSEEMKRLVHPFDVECVDGAELIQTSPYIQSGLIKAGWILKSIAIARCRFEELLFLDADNLPIRDPSFLFDTPQYRFTGAVFWPDCSVFSHKSMWRIFGIPAKDEPEFESGQIMVNKRINWEAISLAEKINWRADVFYRLIWGDKDTFRFAWHKLGRTFAMPDFPPQALQAAGSHANMLCQHDFYGNRLFQHRISYKWDLFRRNPWISGFFFEHECRGFLEELELLWNGRCRKPTIRTRTSDVRAIERDLIKNIWLLELPKKLRGENSPRRPPSAELAWTQFRFAKNGALGKGASEEAGIFWDVSRAGTGLQLTLSDEDGPTVKLKPAGLGWQGKWVAGQHKGKDAKMLELQDVYPHLRNKSGNRNLARTKREIRRHFKDVVHATVSTFGIGDHIVGTYACAGLARMGVPVVFHTRFSDWLARIKEPGLIISSESATRDAHELYYDYPNELRYATSRARWYAGALHPLLEPAKPIVDRSRGMDRLPFERYILLSPIATDRSREWPDLHWVRLAHLLREAGYEVVALGKNQESERLQNIFNETQVYRATGHSAEWVMDAMLGAKGYVGIDSGLTHLAALLDINAVAIHAQLRQEFLWPANTVSSISPDARCVFCRGQIDRGWLVSCKKGCTALASVQPETVLDAVFEIMNAKDRVGSSVMHCAEDESHTREHK